VEPPGANCRNGGIAIETGIDANGDGMLAGGEVQSIEYVCKDPHAIDDNVTIHSWDDLASLDGITTITGSLVIDAPMVDAIVLTELEVIGGDLYCGAWYQPCNLVLLSLPQLQTVGDIVMCPANAYGVTCACDVGTMPLSAIELSSLASVKTLSLYATAIAQVTLPSLARADELHFDCDPQLRSISLPALKQGCIYDPGTTATLKTPMLPRSHYVNCTGTP
jgi:hypothetical protein